MGSVVWRMADVGKDSMATVLLLLRSRHTRILVLFDPSLLTCFYSFNYVHDYLMVSLVSVLSISSKHTHLRGSFAMQI
jgi:hypothetical protein